jgi:putative ABC transport system permease protein
MHGLWQDVRYAARSLRKQPAFTAVATITLALGIGATTVIFSAIDGILIEPFPYKDAGRLTSFYIHDVTRPNENGRNWFSMPEFMDFREQNRVFEDLMGTSFLDVIYTNQGETQLFSGSWVTPNTFDFLGVKPLLGRPVTADDARPGAPPVFVLSARGWEQHFNGDATILGRTFVLTAWRGRLSPSCRRGFCRPTPISGYRWPSAGVICLMRVASACSSPPKAG